MDSNLYRVAVIDDKNVVENIIVASSEFSLDGKTVITLSKIHKDPKDPRKTESEEPILLSQHPKIGWIYDSENRSFSPPQV